MGHRGIYKQRKLRVSECREKVYFYYAEQEQLGRSQQSSEMPPFGYSHSSSKHLLIFSLRYSRHDKYTIICYPQSTDPLPCRTPPDSGGEFLVYICTMCDLPLLVLSKLFAFYFGSVLDKRTQRSSEGINKKKSVPTMWPAPNRLWLGKSLLNNNLLAIDDVNTLLGNLDNLAALQVVD